MVKIFSLLIYRVKWMEENGVTYKPDCIVFRCFQEDIPIFGIIKEILSINKIFYFVLHLLETVTFNPHFHAYEVIATKHYHACTQDELQDYHPLWLYESYSVELNGTWFVPLKYHVLSNIS